jgi:hypothetical protein
MPEMFFVMIGCADDMPWLITTRAFSRRKRNRCANPIRLDASDTNIIRSGRRASSSLGVLLRDCFISGRQ